METILSEPLSCWNAPVPDGALTVMVTVSVSAAESSSVTVSVMVWTPTSSVTDGPEPVAIWVAPSFQT